MIISNESTNRGAIDDQKTQEDYSESLRVLGQRKQEDYSLKFLIQDMAHQ